MAAAERGPSGLPVGVHYPVVSGGRERPVGDLSDDLSGHLSDNARARGDGEFGGVAAELVHPVAVRVEDHGDEEAQLAIAQHGERRAGRDGDLVQDLAGGGQRLQEDGAAGGDLVGEDV